MAGALCSECIEDKFLRALVRSEESEKLCDVCGQSRSHAITIVRLGELIEPLISEHFRTPAWPSYCFEENEFDYSGRKCEDLDSIVRKVLGQYFEFNSQITDAVISSQRPDKRQEEMPSLKRGAKYVEDPSSGDHTRLRWLCAKNELSKTQRFFNTAVQSLFDELFSDIDCNFFAKGTSGDGSVVTEIPTGFVFFRARICRENLEPFSENSFLNSAFKDPYKEIGPPPPHLARAQRMNAEGISVLYGATDKDTCLAELRPAIGGQSVIVSLRTTKSLKILDFTRMRTAQSALSFFQPDFSSQKDKFAFLQILGILISQPVAAGNEADYLITQTMMEYLSHVHSDPFDGVLYHSAQHNGGKNIALFAKMVQDHPIFPVEVQGLPTIYETKSIEYEHEELKSTFNGKTVQADYSFAEELGLFS